MRILTVVAFVLAVSLISPVPSMAQESAQAKSAKSGKAQTSAQKKKQTNASSTAKQTGVKGQSASSSRNSPDFEKLFDARGGY